MTERFTSPQIPEKSPGDSITIDMVESFMMLRDTIGGLYPSVGEQPLRLTEAMTDLGTRKQYAKRLMDFTVFAANERSIADEFPVTLEEGQAALAHVYEETVIPGKDFKITAQERFQSVVGAYSTWSTGIQVAKNLQILFSKYDLYEAREIMRDVIYGIAWATHTSLLEQDRLRHPPATVSQPLASVVELDDTTTAYGV